MAHSIASYDESNDIQNLKIHRNIANLSKAKSGKIWEFLPLKYANLLYPEKTEYMWKWVYSIFVIWKIKCVTYNTNESFHKCTVIKDITAVFFPEK